MKNVLLLHREPEEPALVGFPIFTEGSLGNRIEEENQVLLYLREI